jgi:hypothetical protein
MVAFMFSRGRTTVTPQKSLGGTMTDPALLDDVFDKFIGSTSIFRDREVLRHDYLPVRLPHREDQIRQLGQTVHY